MKKSPILIASAAVLLLVALAPSNASVAGGRTLMSHLAQFSSFSKQGELLCTHGLAYLLQNPDARRAFHELISESVGRTLDPSLTWRAEARQKDYGRPDLEARTADGRVMVKIEAKLDAAFGEGQLISYIRDLQSNSNNGVVLVLVPRRRADAIAEEIIETVSPTFTLIGNGPWRLDEPSDCLIAVIYWEDVLEALETVHSEEFESDLAQFQSMYRVLKGYDIEVPTTDSEVLAWRNKEDAYVSVIDRVTRRLSPKETRVNPLRDYRDDGDHSDYQSRYVCLPLDTEEPCFSLGVRDPFKGYKTFVWMRFHHDTPKFPLIRERLMASTFSQRLVESSGNIWIPLDVPLSAHGDDGLVGPFVTQAQDVIELAYKPLS
jgi:hypothetical protein